MKIKKGDQVKILKGKDHGKSGKISRVFPDQDMVVVEGLNVYKKRSRPKQQGKKGEVVLIARPISVSNVALICDSCKKPTRAGFRVEGEKKFRYCKKCGVLMK